MSFERQWLRLGLEDLPSSRARRIMVFRLLLTTASTMRARLDRVYTASGVTVQQAALLQFIEASPAPPALSEVAQAMNMTHQNAKQIAAALERKGFLVIATDEADRRVRRLEVTAKHRRFWKKRNPTDFTEVEAWTSPLDDEEVATLLDLLARVQTHLRAAVTPDGPPSPRPPPPPQRTRRRA